MIGMRAAEAIFKGGAGGGDDVVTVKQPVHIHVSMTTPGTLAGCVAACMTGVAVPHRTAARMISIFMM
jgi:hypothetical protein